MRSMFRLICAAALLTTSAAFADPPKFSQGGVLFDLRYGAGWWAMDAAHVESQVGLGRGAAFVGALAGGRMDQASHTLALSLAYNILGHASVGADFTATGWNVFDASRGGAGFVTGKVAWHPLELVFLKKEQRPIPLDVNTSFGVGYGIAGANQPLFGMDGLVFQWGLEAQYFLARYFGLGAYVKGTFLDWRKFYLDYDNKVFVELPNGSGGSYWNFGITLTFRAGD